ncbi:MAG: phosphodiester glycosidase family protein [Clostridia bacterium]
MKTGRQRRLRRVLLLGLLLGLLAGGTMEKTTYAARSVGDMDGNGTVTAADAARILRAAQRYTVLTSEQRICADVTANNVLDGTDARAAAWLATGQIVDYGAFLASIRSGLCDERYFDRFRYTGVTDSGDGNYRSKNVGVWITRGEAYNSVYYLADIYIRDIQALKTGFGGNKYQGGSEKVGVMAANLEAIVAVNGDYYAWRAAGPLVRNGEVYREYVSYSGEIAFLSKDGTFTTLPAGLVGRDTVTQLDVYQTWMFGPPLLDENGNAKTKFTGQLLKYNPRSVFGYYEPGHYALILVDGRQKDYSLGMEMQELSSLCHDLGLAAAYNLDGGRSAVMASKYGPISHPQSKDGRPVSDIVYVCEP